MLGTRQAERSAPYEGHTAGSMCNIVRITANAPTAVPRRGEDDMKILMVLTSHDQLGNTGKKTGFWLEEFAAPYFAFKDAGVQLTWPRQGRPATAGPEKR
jgi:putative intracellular protease/amidase